MTAGMRAEEELRLANLLLTVQLEATVDGILVVDGNGRIISSNRRFVEMWGIPPELMGSSSDESVLQSVIPKLANPDEFVQKVNDLYASGDAEFRDQIALKDGRIFDRHTASLRGADGVHYGRIWQFRDITESKRVEDGLREKGLVLSESQRLGHVGSWFWDMTGPTSWSEEMYRIYGVSPDTFTPTVEALIGLIHPDDRSAMQSWIAACATGEQPGELEYRINRPDGTTRVLLGRGEVVLDAANKPVHMGGTAQDITERTRAEETLRKSEGLHRAILQSAMDGFWLVGEQGRLLEVNETYCRMSGYSTQELLAMRIPDLEAVESVEDTAARIQGIMARGDARFESKHRRKDGSVFDVEVSVQYRPDGDGRCVAFLQDITERTRAAEGLRKAKEEAERLSERLSTQTTLANQMAAKAEAANMAKSEFLANMSHEIRTPLNGVIGVTGLLLDTSLDDEQRRYLEIVRASGESLLGLLNDILDFSKIEAGRLDLETLDFDLSSLMDDFAETMAARAHDKGLELLCSVDPDVPALLRGDPGRLRQILTNLVGNAVKFTSTGEVAVRVSLVEPPEQDVRMAHEDGHDVVLRFSVRDTGLGIPKDKIGVLFDKFSQVDTSTTRHYGGTGLGLAISKQLAELMAGAVGVVSEEGKGSEFWFTVRLGTQPGGTRAEKRPLAELRGVRALIVDDNAAGRDILTTCLESWGMRPWAAPGGDVALPALHKAFDENDPFRVAVIDMQMPGMDGETLGRTIAADKRLADTRMVMLTSLGTRGDARRFEEIGFAGYATKPIRSRDLQAVLSLALRERDGATPTPRPIVTHHQAREMLNLFAGRKGRILVAEDNITNQRVAPGILKKLGLYGDAVANGAEALNALETIPYDLVLMDVQMPEMDGLQATRTIRKTDTRLPIIAMTAHAMRGDRERCLEAGMDDYLTKPVTPKALALILGKWLPKHAETPG
jgi:PAS domain S-box-containing protein